MAKPSRSRKLPVSQPPRSRWTPALIEGVVAGEAAVLGAVIARETIEAAVEAAAAALARAEELTGAAIARDPAAKPIACRAGCSSCCAAKVVVTPPEILRIVAHLRAGLDEAALDALRERVRALDAETRGKTRQERAELKLSCPLLDESGSCSVHAVRPLHCLGWTSFDAAACERHWAAPGESLAPPHHDDVYELGSAVMAGLARACIEEGLDGSLLELIAALRIALDRPNAGERWLRRLPVFSTAIDEEWRMWSERP